jgi:hypothetical protein
MLKIKLTSVMVHDPETAHLFYTNVLGFQTKMNMEMGEFKFITVVSPEAPDEVELLLEPNNNPAAKISKPLCLRKIYSLQLLMWMISRRSTSGLPA